MILRFSRFSKYIAKNLNPLSRFYKKFSDSKPNIYNLNDTNNLNEDEINQIDKMMLNQAKQGTETNSKNDIDYEQNYKENINQLNELYKIFQKNIERLPLDKLLQVLKVYSHHKIDNEELYEKCEKTILKYLQTLTPDEFASCLISFSLTKRKMTSRFILLMETKLMKNISAFNTKQIYEIMNAFSRMNEGSLKLYRSIQNYYLFKLNEFKPFEKLDLALILINSGRLLPKHTDEILLTLYDKMKSIIYKLELSELIRFLLLFHTKTSSTRKLHSLDTDDKKIEKSNIKNQVLSTLYGNVQDNTKMYNNNLVNSIKENIFFAEYDSNIESYVIKTIVNAKTLNLNTFLIIFKVYNTYDNKTIPYEIISKFIEYLDSNKYNLIPMDYKNIYNEYMKFNEITRMKLKRDLDNVYEKYINKYLNEFNYEELTEIWKILDFSEHVNKETLIEKIGEILKKNINEIDYKDLIVFGHLRILSLGLYINKDKSVSDELLIKYIFPTLIKQMHREREIKTYLIMIRWFTNINITDHENLLANFINIIPKLNIVDGITYFQVKQYLEYIRNSNSIQLIPIIDLISAQLVNKYEQKDIQMRK